MNELKPEDVMKALEICADKTQTCMDCPYTDHCSDFGKDALALLREKDAEIERLRGIFEELEEIRGEYLEGKYNGADIVVQLYLLRKKYEEGERWKKDYPRG